MIDRFESHVTQVELSHIRTYSSHRFSFLDRKRSLNLSVPYIVLI